MSTVEVNNLRLTLNQRKFSDQHIIILIGRKRKEDIQENSLNNHILGIGILSACKHNYQLCNLNSMTRTIILPFIAFLLLRICKKSRLNVKTIDVNIQTSENGLPGLLSLFSSSLSWFLQPCQCLLYTN